MGSRKHAIKKILVDTFGDEEKFFFNAEFYNQVNRATLELNKLIDDEIKK